MERPGQCFLSYSHHDHDGFERLLAHVKPLESLYGFTIFHDRRLTAGSHWNDRIKAEVEKSNIYVALVTTDFLASDYILQHELPAMLHRYGARKALFVPVIYRDCGWEGFFGDYIQATPLDAKYRLLPVCDFRPRSTRR